MPTAKRVPAVEGLFSETAEGPRLLGSKCVSCGTPYFPRSAICHNPNCEKTQMEDASFGPRGRLWSCAVQNYPPPPPAVYQEPYQPYAIGAVDLPDGLRVMGRIDTDDPQNVPLGVEVELMVEAFGSNDEGDEIVSWMFKLL
jgi:uncharacterized OB-fold protein